RGGLHAGGRLVGQRHAILQIQHHHVGGGVGEDLLQIVAVRRGVEDRAVPAIFAEHEGSPYLCAAGRMSCASMARTRPATMALVGVGTPSFAPSSATAPFRKSISP